MGLQSGDQFRAFELFLDIVLIPMQKMLSGLRRSQRLLFSCLFRYPSSLEEFYKCGLEGQFDDASCGKRMKLETPETWETQVSIHGNKAEIWEKLIGERDASFLSFKTRMFLLVFFTGNQLYFFKFEYILFANTNKN